MGMHEIEGAVEGVVLVLDESPLSKVLDMRSICDSLARFVVRWDASFQHFHVLAPLLKHRYTYVFPVTEHPEYEQHKAYFDGLRKQEFLLRHPDREWDGETNPEVGIYCHPMEAWGANYLDQIPDHLRNVGMLYFDAGSELWRLFVDVGKLTGKDAEPPREIPLEEIVSMTLTEARKQNHTILISIWYPLMAAYAILNAMDKDWQARRTEIGIPQDSCSAQAIMANPHFQAIRNVVIETRAFEYNNDYGLTRLPAEKEFETGFEVLDDSFTEQGWGQFLDWWYEPLKNMYAEKRNQA
ncbi:hypothetical protein NDK47_11030 [Brevibacillus ruminantium]|uniref:Uncharacterized protein n=1 Tax=Brevibacillus ruminantium TaxID=2950604 RepID=A0ABY4WM70_9BACL|nr:hypothetical protein [Brevibacillus ruminantium]USG67769.1 hypothetical protein NDK47_11030 [Brevibacillus ruminantium]